MIVFFGTSHRSAKFLELVLHQGLKPNLVVSEPPKPVGKKQVLTENPTIVLSKRLGLPSVTSFKELSLTMKQWSNEAIGLILDFNKIIPGNIINLFSKGIINIHFSKLPAYRGPAPVQYTILNGDKEAWITYYLINEKVDAGPIIAQTSLPLDQTETTEELYQKLTAKAAAETSKIVCYSISNGKLFPQTGTPSYTKKLTTENCKIDWTKSPEEIDRLIRAAYPEPTAWTEVMLHGNITQPSSRVPPKAGSRDPFPRAGERDSSMRDAPSGASLSRNDKIHRIKILKAHFKNNKLELDQVQLEGKNPVTWKQFQEGHPTFSLS